MKSNVLCSVPAMVSIQGPRVLRLLECQGRCALFDVIGFEEQIFIKDFRSNTLNAIAELDTSDDVQNFIYEFIAPALVTIKKRPDETLSIKLEDTDIVRPENMLWIAVGLEDNFPLYDYLLEYIVPFNQNSLAIVSLYRRPSGAYPLSEESIEPSFSSSSDSTESYNTSSERRGLRISSSIY